jgi:ketosteroid isomerase-like protein
LRFSGVCQEEAMAETFDHFLKRREEISGAYINGEADGLIDISVSAGDASFFPPSGSTVQGAKKVNAANKEGAGAFASGSKGHFEIYHSGAAGDVGYWTGLQHAEAMLKGKDKPVPMTLRVTEVFRKQDGEWKLIHRHADEYKAPE